MAELIMLGAPVAKKLCADVKGRVERLGEKGVTPCICILRIGELESETAYERAAAKRCESVGIEVRRLTLPESISQEQAQYEIEKLNNDPTVHGVLLLLPFPKGLDSRALCDKLSPEKDVDAVSSVSSAYVYLGNGEGFAPCTACAALEMLDYYGIDPAGKRAAVIGRSLVVGRPVSMLLLRRNATVTVCHSKTPDPGAVIREADIVIAAAGSRYLVKEDWVRPGQVIIDVGTSWDAEQGRLCGDVSPGCEAVAAAISPVPGGVGTVTTAVLALHVTEAAEKRAL